MKSKIYFVCDGGMGSSALGASLLQRTLKSRKIFLQVANCSIAEIPDDVEILICHNSFYNQLRKKYPNMQVYSIDEYTNVKTFERIVDNIMNKTTSDAVLAKENIVLNCESCSSDEAIVAVGKMLHNAGYIEEPYIEGMLKRDHALTTFIGNNLAIPHGEYEVKDYVSKTGLAVMIYPEGIDWHGEFVQVVIGIAAKNDDHMNILSNIACQLCEMETVEQLVASSDVNYVHNILTTEAA